MLVNSSYITGFLLGLKRHFYVNGINYTLANYPVKLSWDFQSS